MGAIVDISVLVPVYNEDSGLDRCYREIVAAMESCGHSFEIVFVDDGSTDDSLGCMRSFAAADRRVTVVKLMHNVGQQRAMYLALRYCSGRAVITYDADLQFHPECLSRLADKVFEGYDVVGGVRTVRRDSLFANRIPSWVGRSLINRALHIQQQDFGGVKAYSARMVKMLLSASAPLIVLPAMAYSMTRRVIEIPVRHEPRISGISKWSVLSRMELYLDLYTLYSRRPFSWMLLGGVASFMISLLLGVGIAYYRFFVSQHFSGLIIFFDIFLFVTGIYLSSLSLIGEFVVRGLRRGRPDAAHLVEEVIAIGDTSPGQQQYAG